MNCLTTSDSLRLLPVRSMQQGMNSCVDFDFRSVLAVLCSKEKYINANAWIDCCWRVYSSAWSKWKSYGDEVHSRSKPWYIRVHSGTFGYIRVHLGPSGLIVDVRSDGEVLIHNGSFGATTLPFYKTKRGEGGKRGLGKGGGVGGDGSPLEIYRASSPLEIYRAS